ncbi:MAG: DUF3179 domain-containing protein [Actinomycetota bacterium]
MVLLAAGVLFLAACARAGGPAAVESGAAGATLSPSASAAEQPNPRVDPNEIQTLLPPDGIPAIDDPAFLSPAEADFLDPREPVLAIELNGDARAYPAQIMTWHEIVNDTVGGVPVVVTYCPLCNTGIGFERPTVDGELLDFGTSGKLYRSNLVMYDRQTNSLWPQALGRAVQGPLLGMELEWVPVQLVSWGDWRAAHPDGKVLSTETGSQRPYGTNPYENYDDPDSFPFAFDGDLDPRLPPKARVVGVQIGDDVVAFPYAELRDAVVGDWAVVEEPVGGRPLVVFWKAGTASALDEASIADSSDVGATGTFSPSVDGRRLTFRAERGGIVDLETGSVWDIFGLSVEGPLAGSQLDRVIATESFWFDWAAFHPDTRIFGA